jgi:hypothetical protein
MDDLPPSAEAPPSGPCRRPNPWHHDDHGHEHHELGFWRSYIFSTDHKTIGIQYLSAGFSSLFFGFCLMLLMRWQLAFPGQALTWANASNHMGIRCTDFLSPRLMASMPPIAHAGSRPTRIIRPCCELIFGKDQMPGGVMTPDFLQHARRDARHDHGLLRHRARRLSPPSAITSCRCRSARSTWPSPA